MDSYRGCLHKLYISFGYLLFIFVQDCASLRAVEIHVPEAVEVGRTVKLQCQYDLEGVALYSIKWYRDDQEFYRFVPRDTPPYRVFPQGIHVDLSQSSAQGVTLLDVQRNLTGFYKCEVSADAPLFHTEIKSAFMIVAVLPKEKPLVLVEKLKYTQGERIRANCTVPASYPVANITWYLNGKEVHNIVPIMRLSPPEILLQEPEEGDDDAAAGAPLEAVRKGVEVVAGASTFVEGRARLLCLATLFTLYNQTAEVELVEDAPQIAPVMGPTAPHSLDISSRSVTPHHAALGLALLLQLFVSR